MSDSDSDSFDEYEAQRKRNIAEKERMFAELGLDNVIIETKKLFEKADEFEENITEHERIRSRRSRQRNSVRINDLLPVRRSRRIEKQIHRVKRVKGFKGFSGNCNYSVREHPNEYDCDKGEVDSSTLENISLTNSVRCDSEDNCTRENCERTCSVPQNVITVRFPWYKQLCSKINSSNTSSAHRRTEDDVQRSAESLQKLSLLEADEMSILKHIFKLSSMIKSYESKTPSESGDSDDDESDDNWDSYEKVEFYVLTSDDESEHDSDYDSPDEMPREQRRRRVHSRASVGVQNISPDDVTEDLIKNIAKRGFNKIYDQINGTTCHQCRQKTSDTKTVCRSGRCVGVRGMFCGLCLPNRYGESVEEALKDPDWQCPVCRGICNCSFCRARAGKTPTGILYPTVKNRGYENVAEFLKECDKENNSVNYGKKRMKIVGVRG